MRIIRKALFCSAKRHPLRLARQRKDLLESDPATIRQVQLGNLNAVWDDARRNVPYYARLKEQRKLPDLFRSLDEYADRMPILSKDDIRQQPDMFRRPGGRAADGTVSTGGSTGEPLSFGVWTHAESMAGANYLIGRGWYGVVPGDKLFMVWGHRHLMGTGMQRLIAGIRRRTKDALLGYRRENAYRLSEADVTRIMNTCRRYLPDYIVGYSSVLSLLARSMTSPLSPAPKVVIACGETLEDDDRSAIVQAFGAPVAMEYGSVECNLIAHTHPQGGYRTFWDTHLVEAGEPDAGQTPLLITKLTGCYAPLLRYQINDVAVVEQSGGRFLTSFGHILGRCQDIMRLKDGKRIHPAAVSGMLKQAKVSQFQLVRRSGELAELRLRLDSPLTKDTERAIRANAGRVSEELARLPLVAVADMPKTPAGKVRWYVDE